MLLRDPFEVCQWFGYLKMIIGVCMIKLLSVSLTVGCQCVKRTSVEVAVIQSSVVGGACACDESGCETKVDRQCTSMVTFRVWHQVSLTTYFHFVALRLEIAADVLALIFISRLQTYQHSPAQPWPQFTRPCRCFLHTQQSLVCVYHVMIHGFCCWWPCLTLTIISLKDGYSSKLMGSVCSLCGAF